MNLLTSRYLSVLLGLLVLLSSCGNHQSGQSESETGSPSVEEETMAITLSEVTSPEFVDAMLEMNAPDEGASIPAGTVTFSYEVKNYQLGAQTLDADIKQCANSGDGQHIHLILNNEPYSAHYQAEFEKELLAGHYVALSFLSRSYHESIKQYGAYNLRQFSVGESDDTEIDLTAPHMFYSRPKGEYKGADTRKVLLDFYLVNTDLSPEGNKVKVTINGQHEFLLDKWAPYFLEGLPIGQNTVELELLDADGNAVPGPYNRVERTFTLSPDSST